MTTNTERVLNPVAERSLYPEELLKAEDRDVEVPAIGVALSGGGIRSATLSLGFFQGLARYGLVSSIKYLSTVSGGGYFGAFFGHLFQREAQALQAANKSIPPDLADEIFLRDPEAPAFRYLRENGRYLSPNGSGDLLAAASVALRNWFAVIIVIGLLALALLTVAAATRFEILTQLQPWVAGWSLPRPLNLMSPFLLAAPLAVLVLAVPPAWAYWLVPDNPRSDSIIVTISKWMAPLAGVPAFLVARGSNWYVLAVLVSIASVLTILRYLISHIGGGDAHQKRRHLSRGLTRALVVIGGLLGIGVVDSIGQYIVSLRNLSGAGFVALLAAVGGILRQQILAFATRAQANERPPLPTGLLLYAGALVLIVGMLGIIAAIPHLVANEAAIPLSPLVPPPGWFVPLAWLFAITFALVLAVSRVWSFLNRSSLHAIYEARLRRAYLGASNEKRSGEFENRPAVTEPDADDGMTLKDYDPSRFGGPIHLINVTVNETVDGKSQVQQRDRKGTGLAIGPRGVSVGTKHHAMWETRTPQKTRARVREVASRVRSSFAWAYKMVTSSSARKDAKEPRPSLPFRVFPSISKPEVLDVGQWIAISGGAVSTGLGARTNIALSLLMGFFNVRLGYWWTSGVDPSAREGETRRTKLQHSLALVRRCLPVQFALLDEWLARFPGVARREWYLTDGGHFENLGGYELLRRQLPFIVVCDNEQDRDYRFDGLANLVRKARTDLKAEISFLSDEELAANETLKLPDCIGSLESLRRGRRSLEPPINSKKPPRIEVDGDRSGLSLKHAALARITYGPRGPDDGGREGWLLYIKPSLDGDESIDVLRYHTEHPDFPQESTSDQFFAEAQWESYRKLGEHLALQVFKTPPDQTSWLESLVLGDEASRRLAATLSKKVE